LGASNFGRRSRTEAQRRKGFGYNNFYLIPILLIGKKSIKIEIGLKYCFDSSVFSVPWCEAFFLKTLIKKTPAVWRKIIQQAAN